MISHSGGNAVVDRLHAGIGAAGGERINELGVGAFEACARIAAAANQLPNDHLCGDPFLTVGAAEILFTAWLTVQKRNIDRFSLVG